MKITMFDLSVVLIGSVILGVPVFLGLIKFLRPELKYKINTDSIGQEIQSYSEMKGRK